MENENSEKKRYLMRYLEAVRREKELALEMEELEGRYILPSKVIDGMPHGSGSDKDLSAFAEQYDRLYRKLKAAYKRSMTIYEQVSDAIEGMDTSREDLKTILRYRYMRGYTFERIAVEMHYTYRHVTRMHGQALAKVKMSYDVL